MYCGMPDAFVHLSSLPHEGYQTDEFPDDRAVLKVLPPVVCE